MSTFIPYSKKAKVEHYIKNIAKFKGHKRGQNWHLLGCVLLLLIIGIISLYSSSYFFSEGKYGSPYYMLKKQIISIIFGIIFLLIISKLDYHLIISKSRYLYISSILLLIFVRLIDNKSITQYHRFFKIGSLDFSTHAYAVFALVIYLSSCISKIELLKLDELSSLFKVYVLILIPSLLLSIQPNITYSIVLMLSGTMVLFLGGIRLRNVFPLMFSVFSYISLNIIMNSARIHRLIESFSPLKDPLGSGFQINQSLIAIGSGGILGAGIGQGVQKYNYLPDIQSTFILANIGEELGFVGLAIVIILFVLFLIRGYLISSQTDDLEGKILSASIIAWIGIMGFFNIGVVISMFPVAGISFPFLSYGGTEIFLNLVSVGILISVANSQIRVPSSKYRLIPHLPMAMPDRRTISFLHKLKEKYSLAKLRMAIAKIEDNPFYKLLVFFTIIASFLLAIYQIVVLIKSTK